MAAIGHHRPGEKGIFWVKSPKKELFAGFQFSLLSKVSEALQCFISKFAGLKHFKTFAVHYRIVLSYFWTKSRSDHHMPFRRKRGFLDKISQKRSKKLLFRLKSLWWPMAAKTAHLCPKMAQNHSLVHTTNVFEVFQYVQLRNKALECLRKHVKV